MRRFTPYSLSSPLYVSSFSSNSRFVSFSCTDSMQEALPLISHLPTAAPTTLTHISNSSSSGCGGSSTSPSAGTTSSSSSSLSALSTSLLCCSRCLRRSAFGFNEKNNGRWALANARRHYVRLPDKDQAFFSAYTEIDLPSESRIAAMNSVFSSSSSGGYGNDWVVTEKIHGANFGVYYLPGVPSDPYTSNNNSNNGNNNDDFSPAQGAVKFAKRSGIMDPNEHFFGYHVLIPELTAHVTTVARLLEAHIREHHMHQDIANRTSKSNSNSNSNIRLSKVVLHGELFGARYDHPLVPKSTRWATLPNKKRIPISGVVIQEEEFPQYSPELHFFAFDIKYSIEGDFCEPGSGGGGGGGASALGEGEGEEEEMSDLMLSQQRQPRRKKDSSSSSNNSNTGSDSHQKQPLKEKEYLLNYDDFESICSRVPGLLYAQALQRGTLDFCLSFDVENFLTPTAARLGLGNYLLEKNYAEGIVIRHARRGDIENMKNNYNSSNSPSGNQKLLAVPTILKLRNSAFMELKHPGMQREMKENFYDSVRAAAVQRAAASSSSSSSSSAKGNNVVLLAEAMLPALERSANALLLNHVSGGRLANVLSKIGTEPLADGSVGRADVVLLLARDALKDFLKQSDDAIQTGGGSDSGGISKENKDKERKERGADEGPSAAAAAAAAASATGQEVHVLNMPLFFRRTLIENVYHAADALLTEERWEAIRRRHQPQQQQPQQQQEAPEEEG